MSAHHSPVYGYQDKFILRVGRHSLLLKRQISTKFNRQLAPNALHTLLLTSFADGHMLCLTYVCLHMAVPNYGSLSL